MVTPQPNLCTGIRAVLAQQSLPRQQLSCKPVPTLFLQAGPKTSCVTVKLPFCSAQHTGRTGTTCSSCLVLVVVTWMNKAPWGHSQQDSVHKGHPHSTLRSPSSLVLTVQPCCYWSTVLPWQGMKGIALKSTPGPEPASCPAPDVRAAGDCSVRRQAPPRSPCPLCPSIAFGITSPC